MKRTTMVLTAFLVAWMIALPMGWAQTDKDHTELAKALEDVTFPVEKGLSASGREGHPVSAKYELEHGQRAALRLKDGHPVAEVTPVKDTRWKTVSEKLD
jgi:hypothetical protein